MSNLIDCICQNGVQYKPIAEVATIKRGVRVVKVQLAKQGKFPVYQNSITPMGYYSASNCPANTTFIIGAGAAGEIGYSFVDFWAADDCFYFICSNALDNRYLYHALLCQQPTLLSKVRKASIPRISRTVIENLIIPVPPLEVQREIVRILDHFTELTTELEEKLTAELTARKKQYAYYRNKLLTFGSSVKKESLKVCGIISRGEYITKKSAVEGNIPVILGGQEPAYFINRHNHTGKAIVISRSGASAGFVSYWDEPIFVTDGFIVEGTEIVDIRFLYYFLKNYQAQLNALKKGGGVPHITGKDIGEIQIPILSRKMQKEIVSILDRFDALVNDLTSDLPAEIEARRKQYEYYRDKLLSFPALQG